MKEFFKKRKYLFISLASIALLIGVWEIVAVKVGVDFVLPRFSDVMSVFFGLFKTKTFYVSVGHTLLRCIVGFCLSFVLGTMLGILGGIFPSFGATVKPICSFIRAVPTMAITLIIMVWFKSGIVPVVIGFMMVFPIIYTSVCEGISTTDKKLLQMASVYGFSFKQKLFDIYFPHVLPEISTSAINAFGLNIKAVISAEILAYTVDSIGMAMYIAKSNILDDAAYLFAWVLVAVVLSGIFEMLLGLISSRIARSKKL